MISTTQVLDEIERQLSKARMSEDDTAVRESLAAIESICTLVLKKKPAKVEVHTMAATTSNPPQVSYPPSEGKKLEEEDANGGSLFDF